MLPARIFCSIILAVFLMATSASARVTAQETVNYGQQILPIDCVYEVVDTGTQTLRYLTPETCPTDPNTPVTEEPQPSAATDAPATTPIIRPADSSSPRQTTQQTGPPGKPNAPADQHAELDPPNQQSNPSFAEMVDYVIKRYDIIILVVILSYLLVMLSGKHKKQTKPKPKTKPKRTKAKSTHKNHKSKKRTRGK